MNNTNDYIGGVVFSGNFLNNGSHLSKDIMYSIRLSSYPRNAGPQKFTINPFNSDTRWRTRFQFPMFQKVGPRENSSICGGSPGYYREGFLSLEYAINNAIFEELAINSTRHLINETEINTRRQPYPPYEDDDFVIVIQRQFPFIIMLSFILSALSIVQDVVYEKEKKLKESMKMMGLSGWIHWLAWFIKYFLFLLISIIIMTVLICINFGPNGSVIGQTNPVIISLFLICYSIAVISFCFLVSVFFSNANSGAAAGGILFFCSYIPYFFLQPRYDDLTLTDKLVGCLDFNVAVAYGGLVIGMFEGTGYGVQWSNLGEGASVDDDFSLMHVMLMLLLDSVIYFIIAWYVEAIHPGDYGIPQPWYFPFMKSYWCHRKVDSDFSDGDCIPGVGQNPDYFENDPVNMVPGLKIRSLRKQFGHGDTAKVAVAGMVINMYEGQITALLGHNGAGKTTTMSMLTGFIPPTDGYAIVNGYNIRTDIDEVRSSLGLCPQHDVLFDLLTVEEHLVFFAKLKGFPKEKIPEEVDHMLEFVNLLDKRHALSKTLSGGMKRKLSVGIALIGDSKTVILDEPTSGMDPHARRQIWNVLQKSRAGRTILLSTHFMDEADLLGDRIAIMADGVVKCCGSSLFLKNKYGAGYHMTIVKADKCRVNRITNMVRKYVPESRVESDVGAELSYILPQESSHRFEELFTELENNKDDLGIMSYGASVTTMEEVFLKVGSNRDETMRHTHSLEMRKMKKKRPQGNSYGATEPDETSPLTSSFSTDLSSSIQISDVDPEPKMNEGWRLEVQQFYAMLVKRAIHTFRNKLITGTQLVVPLLFTILALVVIKTFPGPEDSPPLVMTVDNFGENHIIYATANDSRSYEKELAQLYAAQYKNNSQVQMEYVNAKKGFEKNPDIIKYLSEEGAPRIGQYNLHYMIAANFAPYNKTMSVATAYFNDQGYHTPADALTALSNALLKYFSNDTEYQLTVYNHPLPRTLNDIINDDTTRGTEGFSISINVLFGMSFLAASFVLFLVKERAVKAKHVQYVSGVRSTNFWLSTFCWDMINYLIPVFLLIITFIAFQVNAYEGAINIFHLFLLFLLFGFAILPFMYMASFLFMVPSTAFVWVTMFNIIAGIATVLTVAILSIPQLDLKDVADSLEWVFLTFLPHFAFGQALSDYYSNYQFLQLCQTYIDDDYCLNRTLSQPFACCPGNCGDNCVQFNTDFLGWAPKGIGRHITFLIIQAFIYGFGLAIIESGVCIRLWYVICPKSSAQDFTMLRSGNSSIVQEDTDVAKERSRIANIPLGQLMETDKLIMQDLTKFYGHHLAVDHLSLGIPSGECFGLLGINGAGKTTTFKMMTGDELLSDGDAFLDGYGVRQHIREVQKRLGYCPQFDALINELTGKETLYMFGRLRGVPEPRLPYVVNELIESLTLTDYANRQVHTYSGGNKRKLSAALALIGDPAIIFLDEPTTGMDPVARRFLWDVLVGIRDSGKTLVLTSHSMEECEALCTRLAIMVNGQFRCLGVQQHLKNKFGQGYTLLAKVTYPETGEEPDLQPLQKFVEDSFPGSELKDMHEGMVHYHIPCENVTWPHLFGTMEGARAEFNIEDYSVSQTTLEQVFINFARSQRPPTDEETKTCSEGCASCLRCCRPKRMKYTQIN